MLNTNNVTVKNSKGENVTVNFVQKSTYISNLKLAEKMLLENKTDTQILQCYVNKYAEKGKTDVNWVLKRTQIYIQIAKTKISNSKK